MAEGINVTGAPSTAATTDQNKINQNVADLVQRAKNQEASESQKKWVSFFKLIPMPGSGLLASSFFFASNQLNSFMNEYKGDIGKYTEGKANFLGAAFTPTVEIVNSIANSEAKRDTKEGDNNPISALWAYLSGNASSTSNAATPKSEDKKVPEAVKSTTDEDDEDDDEF